MQFLHHLAFEVKTAVDVPKREIIKRTHVAAQELFEQHQQTCPDAQAHIILELCCLVLASYRVLMAETDSPQHHILLLKAQLGNSFRALEDLCFVHCSGLQVIL